MGKARFELARISPRDPKSRSSAHSDTSPPVWTLYYQQLILASEHLPKFGNRQHVILGILKPGRFDWPACSNAMLIRFQFRQIVLFKHHSSFS
jgi:hypothetical protein